MCECVAHVQAHVTLFFFCTLISYVHFKCIIVVYAFTVIASYIYIYKYLLNNWWKE